MALNRYLYPQKSTNIVQEVVMTTQWSVDGAGASNVLANVAGKGITITQSGTTTSTIYTVTFDNSSTVSTVLNVKATYIAAFDGTKKTLIAVKDISTSGCVLQAYDAATQTVGPINAAGKLCVELTCSLSSVPA
jgi:hypothetical protein